jgi:hypothetical protein
LGNNLKGLGLPPTRLLAALSQAGIDGRRRAETLSLAEWAALCHSLQSPAAGHPD